MSEDFRSEPKVKEWISTVKNAGCRLASLDPLHLIHKRNGELLFGLFRTEIRDPDEHPLPEIVLIRGHACVIVPMVRNRDTGEERFVMIRQWRTGSGLLSLEFPAGMVDRESDPTLVAVRELQEETGLTVKRQEVHPLTDKLLYTSAGLQDEGIYFYGCLVELEAAEYASLENRLTGAEHEEEHITVTLKTREQGEAETTSAQVRLGFFLFEKFLASR